MYLVVGLCLMLFFGHGVAENLMLFLCNSFLLVGQEGILLVSREMYVRTGIRCIAIVVNVLSVLISLTCLCCLCHCSLISVSVANSCKAGIHTHKYSY